MSHDEEQKLKAMKEDLEADLEKLQASERSFRQKRDAYKDALRVRGLLFVVESDDYSGNVEVQEVETLEEAKSWARQIESGEYDQIWRVNRIVGPGVELTKESEWER